MKRFILLLALVALGGCNDDPKLKVSTPAAAEKAVIEHLELKVLGEQGFDVSPRLVLAQRDPRLGEAGTQFWQVVRTNLLKDGGIDGIFWVNAETGVVGQRHPVILEP